MDIQVESSVVLAAMIAVLLAFIVPSIIRRGQNPAEPALALAEVPGEPTEGPSTADLTIADPTVAARTTEPHEPSRPRRNTMATPARSRTAAPQQAPFRIKYDRLGVALAGVLAVVVLVAGGVLAPFGVVSGLVPLVAAIVLAGAFIGLRALAVRDRRRKVLARMEAVFHEAMHTAPAAPVVRRTATTVFDAREQAAETPSTRDLTRSHERTAPAPAPAAPPTWAPVEVPKPTYVGAAKADRPVPEPLPAPEEKKAQKVTSILQETRLAEHSARLAESAERGEAAESTARIPGSPVRHQAPQTGGINLDAVLQRRRA